MEQKIFDIYELNKISVWPLAPGYFLILGISILIIAMTFVIRRYYVKKRSSWKWEANSQINSLLEENEIQINLLHNLIKKILINSNKDHQNLKQSDSSKPAAALVGNDLLSYLTENDPKGFDWRLKGTILNNVFTPNKTIKNSVTTRELILAIKKWI